MIDLLIAYYAMGWVCCGVCFLIGEKGGFEEAAYVIVSWIGIFLFLGVLVAMVCVEIVVDLVGFRERGEQYLWRKK